MQFRIHDGSLRVGQIRFSWNLRREKLPRRMLSGGPYRIHFGPGTKWAKPNETWRTIDVDRKRGDIVMDLRRFEQLPFQDGTVDAIYASHTFEHTSLEAFPRILSECRRVLQPGGVLRIVVPDARRSLEAYLQGDDSFPLFKRRRARARARGESPTLFALMREDFLSKSRQEGLLGSAALAHQNAWDFETLHADLVAAGFAAENVSRVAFQTSASAHFAFEGTYESEANQTDRSLYVEAVRS